MKRTQSGSQVALPAVPDPESLLPLDLLLQLQDAIEQGLGGGRAA